VPIEWPTIATCGEPVAVRIESTFHAIIPAVVAFDCCHVYVKLESCEACHPSFLNRSIIVVQMLALELKPWTNRIGVLTVCRGFLAAKAVGDDGSVIDPQAPRIVSASTANGRAMRRMVM
jgi:hypothetical protein